MIGLGVMNKEQVFSLALQIFLKPNYLKPIMIFMTLEHSILLNGDLEKMGNCTAQKAVRMDYNEILDSERYWKSNSR